MGIVAVDLPVVLRSKSAGLRGSAYGVAASLTNFAMYMGVCSVAAIAVGGNTGSGVAVAAIDAWHHRRMSSLITSM